MTPTMQAIFETARGRITVELLADELHKTRPNLAQVPAELAGETGGSIAHDHTVHDPFGGAGVALDADRVLPERDDEGSAIGRLGDAGE